jgi:ribosomal protein L11 methyltransferase
MSIFIDYNQPIFSLERCMPDAKWLEVSLTVDPELAEAISEVLSRYVSGGVVVESDVKYTDAEDEGTPYGPVRVYGYLPVDEHIDETRRKVAEGLWALGMIPLPGSQSLPEPVFRPIQDEDWMAAWKQHYKPIPIGKRLLILPAWIPPAPGEARIPVKIDPSMAFGTGTHPTTQLCMEFLEDTVRPGAAVIDVGCGSGILSIGALKLGAGHALAVDIDNAAILSTRENAAANGVLERLEAGLGSVAEICAGRFSLRSAPLVLANILAPVIIRLFEAGQAPGQGAVGQAPGQGAVGQAPGQGAVGQAPGAGAMGLAPGQGAMGLAPGQGAVGLAGLVEPGGTVILSGILDEQAAGVIAAAEARGLRFVEQRAITDWVAIRMEKPE